MMSHGINPYHYGCLDLGTSPIINLPDQLWGHVTSPYGPVFLVLAGWVVEIARHNPLAAVMGMRLLALAGTVLFAAAVPVIARSFGRDGATAFTLAALNPLILLHLIGGGHNDALMVGLLAAGYALSRRGHPLLGILCCSLGAVVKVPAIVGVIYIGWEWLGEGRADRERLRPTATALLIAVVVMAAASNRRRPRLGLDLGALEPRHHPLLARPGDGPRPRRWQDRLPRRSRRPLPRPSHARGGAAMFAAVVISSGCSCAPRRSGR